MKINKYYMADIGEGGGKEESPKKDVPKAPTNFVPLSVKQRGDWNNFLDYVDKQGLGGNPKLDARDQSLGLGLMAKYKKTNPDFSITPEMIPHIQYDQYLLRKGNSYPTLNPSQLKYVRDGLNPAYMSRPVSPVDGWLGSLTSKEYYPQAVSLEKTGNVNFGVNFEDYVNSKSNPDILKNYTLTPKQ